MDFTQILREAKDERSASSPKASSVRTTRSTFSRKALTVNLASLTVRVSNFLFDGVNQFQEVG